MNKLSNTKYSINATMDAITTLMRDLSSRGYEVTPQEIDLIEYLVKQVAIASATDCKNLMNEITNAITDLPKSTSNELFYSEPSEFIPSEEK